MELGISSLGNIIDYGLDRNYNDISSMIYRATEECLTFAEENKINLVELVIDPQDLYTEANKQEFNDLVN